MTSASATGHLLPPEYYREAIARLLALAREATPKEIQDLKLALSREMKTVGFPSNADILARCTPEERAKLERMLRMKPTRTLSGVATVTIQSSPAACPHGKCIYCPGGPEWGTAMSYTGDEPAARRAARHEFDPYAQTTGRLADLHQTGHPVDKIDFIIQGGTFPAREVAYQETFIKRAFDALNAFGGTGPVEAESLEAAQLANERAHARMIGLTIETKPDWALAPHCNAMLALGATRVELGVQTLDDGILRATNRGHTVAHTVEAFQAVKDSGFKLCAHVMPGQPGSTFEKDLDTFRQLFEDPRFGPDKLKIYPTLVIPDTPLFQLFQRGKFEPVSEDYVVKLLAQAKARYVPPWCRIMRIERDIPSPRIAGGVKKLNVREMVHEEMARQGTCCRCLRCREPARAGRVAREVTLTRTSFASAGGVEHFLAFEDVEADVVIAFMRLREPSEAAHREEAKGALLLRELKVVGTEVPIGADAAEAASHQHRGHGARLLAEAETLARDLGRERVLVTSGVGVREYYRRRGYDRLGPYMAKRV